VETYLSILYIEIASNGCTTDPEGSGHDIIELIFRHLPEGTDYKHSSICVRIAGNPIEISLAPPEYKSTALPLQ
jgi:hypothetical protein